VLDIPSAVLGAIAVAWALALAAQATGRGRLLRHDELIHSGLPLWAALGLHLLAWQVMVAAMMLPSSLPLMRLFATVSRNQERPGMAMSAFLAGYAAVWSGFGALAFLGDAQVHDTVEATPWLATHPAVIGGGVLALAGAFQFSSLKDRCLKECRHPQRVPATALPAGNPGGLPPRSSAWAVLPWLLLGDHAGGLRRRRGEPMVDGRADGLMVFEKAGREGQRGVRPIGLGLIALGILMLAEPATLSWILGS
jgi:hypothetical protein